MFELNLIKDRAKARQRRRIIFLAITSVCFMAGLCSLFVVSMYLKELNETNDFARQAATKEAEFNSKRGENDTNEPVFRRRRNEVIKAWNEDNDFMAKRPYYSPVFKVLSTDKPGSPYWFQTVSIVTLAGGQTASATGTAQAPQTPKLMLPRSLLITGMIAVVESDVRTQQAMTRWDERMNDREGFVKLVGPARSHLDDSARAAGAQGGGEASRWNEFTITSTNSMGNYGP